MLGALLCHIEECACLMLLDFHTSMKVFHTYFIHTAMMNILLYLCVLEQ